MVIIQKCIGKLACGKPVLFIVSSVMSIFFLTERSWVQIQARYSGLPGQYNNARCLARLKTSFELNPITEGKQGTFPFLFSCL